jgi:phage tail protein X
VTRLRATSGVTIDGLPWRVYLRLALEAVVFGVVVGGVGGRLIDLAVRWWLP